MNDPATLAYFALTNDCHPCQASKLKKVPRRVKRKLKSLHSNKVNPYSKNAKYLAFLKETGSPYFFSKFGLKRKFRCLAKLKLKASWYPGLRPKILKFFKLGETEIFNNGAIAGCTKKKSVKLFIFPFLKVCGVQHKIPATLKDIGFTSICTYFNWACSNSVKILTRFKYKKVYFFLCFFGCIRRFIFSPYKYYEKKLQKIATTDNT